MVKREVTVRVPASRHGPARLRRQGAKRLRLTDTDDEIKAGLAGGTPSKAILPSADYFTEQPETVEYTPWVEKMIRRGSLELVPDQPVAAAPPKPSKPEPEAVVPMAKPAPARNADRS